MKPSQIYEQVRKSLPRWGSFLWDFKGWREDRLARRRGWDLCEDCAQVYRRYLEFKIRNDRRESFWFAIGFVAFFFENLGIKSF